MDLISAYVAVWETETLGSPGTPYKITSRRSLSALSNRLSSKIMNKIISTVRSSTHSPLRSHTIFAHLRCCFTNLGFCDKICSTLRLMMSEASYIRERSDRDAPLILLQSIFDLKTPRLSSRSSNGTWELQSLTSSQYGILLIRMIP